MIYIAQQTVHFNHCKCGWWFPALSPHIKKCPQCRDEVILCRNCGKDITDTNRIECCDDCTALNKKIYNKHYMRDKLAKGKFKKIATLDDICNYDCNNCQYGDCILPVDKDDYYDNETIKMFEDKK